MKQLRVRLSVCPLTDLSVWLFASAWGYHAENLQVDRATVWDRNSAINGDILTAILTNYRQSQYVGMNDNILNSRKIYYICITVILDGPWSAQANVALQHLFWRAVFTVKQAGQEV